MSGQFHSQQDEEPVILRYFGSKVGRFIEIGAYDGITFSNTYALLEKGWSGVLVEPEPTSFMSLMKNTERFGERVTLVNAAVSPEPSLCRFWDSHGGAVSSLDDAHVAKWNQMIEGGMREYWVQTLGVREMFDKFGPAEFINLDVEGINWDLFRMFPFEWPELRMLCVEYDDKQREMLSLSARYGFKVAHTTSQNLILVR